MHFVSLALVAVGLTAIPDVAHSTEAIETLRRALATDTVNFSDLATKDFAGTPLTKADAAIARDLIWKAHEAAIRRDRAAEIRDRKLTDGRLEMPIFVTTFGEKPTAGHSLWISLHGGGNTAAHVNDRQWENQKKLYKLDEGIYVAPRAPTNTWNLWHEPHIDRLFGRLIEDLIVLEGVDPNRVYVMGYSAGGRRRLSTCAANGRSLGGRRHDGRSSE